MKTNTGRSFSRIISIILAIAVACPYAYASDIGRVTYVEGRVDVSKQGIDAVTPLRVGDAIAIGDAVRTKSNSKAEVTFADKSVVRLAQNTRIEVKDYVLDSNNKRKTADIMLDRGKARAIIAKMSDKAEFNISTPNARGTVKGSDVVAFYQAGNSGMLVSEGLLSIANTIHPESKIEIPAGNSVIVPMDGLPQGPRAYIDLEKKMHEQDTSIPFTIARREGATVIKGAMAKLSGDVKITPKSTGVSRTATISDIVETGDLIETGEKGMVEINFDNGCGITLKPNSNIRITNLVIDPRTGEYENLFESTNGKIRARIEGLKGKSRFEIKTPTAVSGARGTIMFLDVLPGMTKSYFEGGKGYITSVMSGLTKNLESGENSSANNAGGVTEPEVTPQGERESMGEGWETGSGVEGYSAPEGGAGGLLGDGVGPDAGIDTGLTEGTGTGTDLQDTPPFTESNPSSIEEDEAEPATPGETTPEEEAGAPPVVLTGDFSGAFGDSDSGYMESPEDDYNEISAELGTDATGKATVDGTYVNEIGGKMFAGDVTATTNDGSAVVGRMDGTWNSWEGAIAGIFVTALGEAGIMMADLLGTTDDPEIGTFTGGGLFAMGKVANGVLNPNTGELLTPEDLSNEKLFEYESNVLGIYDDSGSIEASSSGSGVSLTADYDMRSGFIRGQDWGVWESTYYDGYYDNSDELPDWDAVVGGTNWDENEGYFIGMATGRDDINNNGLRMDIYGVYLDTQYFGQSTGVIYGSYEDGYFEGIGLGGYVETPLTLSGVWGGGDSNMYSNMGGNLSWVGSNWGLIGATTPEWWGGESFSLVAMGKYYGVPDLGQFIWTAPIYSVSDGTGMSYITGDDAAFGGFSAGIWDGVKTDGYIYSLYITPADEGGLCNAGIFSGSLTGSYYSDIEAWMADGVFDIKQMAHGLDPDEVEVFPGEFYVEELYGDMREDGEYIQGSGASGSTYFISGENWGIYALDLDGDSNRYVRNEGSRIWTADINGGGVFGEGSSRGMIKGNMYGLSDITDTGTWSGTVIGEWGEREYYSTESAEEGIYYGLIGGIWDEDVMIGKMVGIYANSGDIIETDRSDLSIAEGAANFYSAAADLVIDYLDGTTLDFSDSDWGVWGIHFAGTRSEAPASNISVSKLEVVGNSVRYSDESTSYWVALGNALLNKDSGRITGAIRGMTLSDIGVGLFSGDILGVTTGSIDWEAIGAGSYEAMGPTQDSPNDVDEFLNLIETGSFSAEGLGSFDNGKTIDADYMDAVTMNFFDQDWGIWEAGLEGVCSTDTSDTFKIAVSGKTDSEVYSEHSAAHIIGTINGSLKDDILAGQFKGAWFELSGDSTLRAGTISGVANGYIDASSPEGVWKAEAVGEFAEVTDLIDPMVFGRNGFTDLQNFISIPVTEAYANIFTLSNDSFIDKLTMDISLYQNAIGKLWTASFSGAYLWIPETSSGWELPLAKGDDNVTLVGQLWSEGRWLALVEGTVGGNSVGGQAGGTYALPDVNGEGTFKGVGAGTWWDSESQGWQGSIDGYFSGGEYSYLLDSGFDILFFQGAGYQSFDSESYIQTSSGDITAIRIDGEGSGIWGGNFAGDFQGIPSGSFRLGVGGAGNGDSSYWLGTLSMARDSDAPLDEFKGMVFSPSASQEGKVDVSILTGVAISSYIDVTETTGTWTATGAGEWVEATDLIDPAVFGLGGLTDLQQFVSVPITEVCSALIDNTISGSFNGGIGAITGSVDISLYANQALSDNGIWAAIINGNYSGMPSEAVNSWALNVSNGSDSANLTGTVWQNNQWVANVTGTVGGNEITGQAGGTYTNDPDASGSGTLTGVGAGTWQAPTE